MHEKVSKWEEQNIILRQKLDNTEVKLEEQEKASSSQILTLTNSLQQADSNLSKSSELVDNLKKELQESSKNAANEVSSLSSRNETNLSLITQLEKEKDELCKDLFSQITIGNSALSKIALLEEDNRELRATIETLKKQYETERVEIRKEIETLKEREEATKEQALKDNKSLHAELKTRDNKIADQIKTIFEKESENKVLQDNYNKLQTTKQKLDFENVRIKRESCIREKEGPNISSQVELKANIFGVKLKKNVMTEKIMKDAREESKMLISNKEFMKRAKRLIRIDLKNSTS